MISKGFQGVAPKTSIFGELFSQHAHLIRMDYLEDLSQRVHRTKTVQNSVVYS